jgi:hypothetical protein
MNLRATVSLYVSFLLFPLALLAGVLDGLWILRLLGVGNAVWGPFAAMTLNHDEQNCSRENHRGCYHMYTIVFSTQIGFILAYLI